MKSVVDSDLIFQNKYGCVLVLPVTVERVELKPPQREGDRFSHVAGATFGICFACSFWFGIIYWWLR